jgi:phosphoribosylglycinamide formyltransferase-1
MNTPKKYAVISSTGASVVKMLYEITDRSEFNLDVIIVDRECGAKNFAIKENIPWEMVGNCSGVNLSDEILKILKRRNIDYVYLFFTRIIKGSILEDYAEKIINFHPSILPACPGLHGFEDTLKSGAMLAGSTAHYIDEGMDTGSIIYQSYVPVAKFDHARLRHIIFSQQCALLNAIHTKLNNNINLLNRSETDDDLAQGFLPNIDLNSLAIYYKILNKE